MVCSGGDVSKPSWFCVKQDAGKCLAEGNMFASHFFDLVTHFETQPHLHLHSINHKSAAPHLTLLALLSRFIMENGAKGVEVIISGKLRAQRAKAESGAMIFIILFLI